MKTTLATQATLKLFKVIPITDAKKKKATKALLLKTVPKGFIFDETVIHNYQDYDILISEVEQSIAYLTTEEMNNAFHKSWKYIKNASQEQLFIDQLLHYITTYGFSSLGIYDETMVYIPDETLNLPNVNVVDKMSLMIIKGMTIPDIKIRLMKLITSGIALMSPTIDNVVTVAELVELTDKEIELIKNKEVKIKLYQRLGKVPEVATEFIRYVIHLATDNTLVIKNKETIDKIKTYAQQNNTDIVDAFALYQKQHGLTPLAQIFYRFKPLFLAFRANDKLKPMINRIRRMAVVAHKPLPVDYLNSITSIIQSRTPVVEVKLFEELKKVNIFRKIRLAYALKYRTNNPDSIMYKIRNGKGYAKEFTYKYPDKAKWMLKLIMSSIIQDMKKQVDGKKIFIPKHMHYTLPATEKQFTGNFPSGSYISTPKNIVFGIHWNNLDDKIVDLDLSMLSPTTGKIGWNGCFRTDHDEILFSGDITDANGKDGATELFYVQKQAKNEYIMFVNFYNMFLGDNTEVPFKILVSEESPKIFKENYMVNPNNVLAVANSTINKRQKILGLLITTTKENRFYFSETYIGQSITSSSKPYVEHSRKYLFNYYKNMITLNDVLKDAGAIIIDDTKDKDDCEIDLSPVTLSKDSILNLLN